MKKIITLAIVVVGLMMIPAATLAQKGPSYTNVSQQGVINSVDSLKAVGNGIKAFFGGTYGASNGQFVGEWQANATMAANASSVSYTAYFTTMATDQQAQTDIATGFQAMGANASQIQCGTGYGPSAVGGYALLNGDCRTFGSTKGLANVSRLKANAIQGGTVGGYDVKTGGAQAIAALVRGGLSLWVNVQIGTVGGIDAFSG